MPTLPTLTVTQAQADRLLAAFGSTAAYKEWLKDALIGYVIHQETKTQVQAVQDSAKTADKDLRAQITT